MITRYMGLHLKSGAACFFAVLLAACVAAPRAANPSPAPLPQPEPSRTTSQTPAPPPTPRPTATAVPQLPTAAASPALCSLLADIALGDLDKLVVNPYQPPSPGSDDPHQGADLAIIDPDLLFAISGQPVYAALGGRVAGIILDRFPYGNAVLIEVPLASLPETWPDRMGLPTPAPPLGPHPALTCPPAGFTPTWPPAARSLYMLYAHLEEAPTVAAGDNVSCGQSLGIIGSSGNALNPHLHLEIRVGQSGANFTSMAHYLPSASPEEMGNYCLWRVSGFFQSADPLAVLSGRPSP